MMKLMVGCALALELPSRARTVARLREAPRQEQRTADTAATAEDAGLNNSSSVTFSWTPGSCWGEE